MDKRKLIGTIIGVMMFALMIVGATYAWLTFSATVTNATANGTTLKYIVNYTKGNNITDIPILSNPTTTTATQVTVKATRPVGSIADNITLKLTTESATSLNLVNPKGSDGTPIRYVVCEGYCGATENEVVNLSNIINSPTTTKTGGTVIVETNDNGDVINRTMSIYTGSIPGSSTQSGTVEYKIYFWLDASSLVDNHVGKKYSGYIHAESVQST